MEALKLERGEIIQFPRELKLEPMKWVQEKAELTARQKAERKYSANCKRKCIIDKEDIMCILSGLSVCTLIGALYFLGCIF